MVYNEDFLRGVNILYISDDRLKGDPYDFVKSLAAKYRPGIIILGQGAEGLILYDKIKILLSITIR